MDGDVCASPMWGLETGARIDAGLALTSGQAQARSRMMKNPNSLKRRVWQGVGGEHEPDVLPGALGLEDNERGGEIAAGFRTNF